MDYYTLWTHQIKTPIAAMRLLLQEEETRTGELEQELFKIEQYADMALQYQRLESLSSDLQLESCSLDGILRQALKKMATPSSGGGFPWSLTGRGRRCSPMKNG